METAWLLDDGNLCLGAGHYGFTMCPYSSPIAIRFAREEDARLMRHVLRGIGLALTANNVKPVEHAWGEPERYDA